MLRSSPAWLKALLIGQFVSAAGALAWLYLTLWLVDDRGFALGVAGVITAAYGVGAIGGNLLGGSLGDRFGLRRSLAASKAVAVLACLAFPIVPDALLLPLAAMTGLSGGIGRPLMNAVVATALPPELRREAIALSRAAFNAGTVLGPPLGGLLAMDHFGWIFVVDGVTSAVLLVVVLRWVPAGEAVVRGPRDGLLRILRRDRAVRSLVLTVLAVDTTYRLLYTALPLFLVDSGAPAWVYGLSISVNGLMIVLFEPVVARRLAHRPAIAVIALGYAVVGAGWLLLGVLPLVVTAFAAVVVISVGEMLYKPTATAYAADLAPAGAAGRYQSLYASASIGGMVLSPLLGTSLYSLAPWAVWPAAGLIALSASFGLRRTAKTPAVPDAPETRGEVSVVPSGNAEPLRQSRRAPTEPRRPDAPRVTPTSPRWSRAPR